MTKAPRKKEKKQGYLVDITASKDICFPNRHTLVSVELTIVVVVVVVVVEEAIY